MHRAAKNMFKCYRSTVPSGQAAFQIQSRDIRERDCWISHKIHKGVLFLRYQRSYLKYSRPLSNVATIIFSKRIKETKQRHHSSHVIFSCVCYGYIHKYTDQHIYLDLSKVTWFATISTDVSGTNIRTNNVQCKRGEINISYSLKEKTSPPKKN